MTRILAKLALISSGALVALAAAAQPDLPPTGAAMPAAKPVERAPKALLTAALPRSAAATVTVRAAGSVLLLADGIVAHADLAQIAPPAPGFVYER